MARKIVIDPRLVAVYRTIGGNIFRRRGAKKMTQQKVADASGVSRSTIEAAEKGLGCSLENLIKLAEVLGCKPQDLFITDEDRKEVSYAHIQFMEKVMESFRGK